MENPVLTAEPKPTAAEERKAETGRKTAAEAKAAKSSAAPDIPSRVRALAAKMSEGVYEKDRIMALALLALVSGESLFLLGPPGTAKSLVARRVKSVLKGAKSFEYLMSRFSTPDEIFGPVSISKLKNEDKYERIVTGYLPDADIVFLDEIWKAGPSIQNALLTAVNERIYSNGSQVIFLPLKLVLAASNELPAEGEGLEALWDRFLIRLVSDCVSGERNFRKIVRQTSSAEPEIPEELRLDAATLAEWKAGADRVEIPDDVLSIISSVRKRLAAMAEKEETSSLDRYVSDRRWKKIAGLMRTSAFLNGRSGADYSDCILLMHTVWNKAALIGEARETVAGAFALDIEKACDKISRTLDECQLAMSEYVSKPEERFCQEQSAYAVSNFFYYVLEGADANGARTLFPSYEYETLPTDHAERGELRYNGSKNEWTVYTSETLAKMTAKPGPKDGKVKAVTLRKFLGGVFIDGSFRRFVTKAKPQPSPAAGTPAGAARKMPPLEAGSVYGVLEEAGKAVAACQGLLDRRKAVLKESSSPFIGKDEVKLCVDRMEKTVPKLQEISSKLETLRQYL